MNNPPNRNDTFTSRLEQRAEETNQILFDGEWMSIEDAEQCQRKLMIDGTLKIAELAFLFFLMLIASLAPLIVLALVGGIPG